MIETLNLPISKEEAWRLYNQKFPIVSMKSWRDPGKVLEDNLGYNYFTEPQYFAIQLTKEESSHFLKLRVKFAWAIIGAGSTFPTGMILTSLSFLAHPESLNPNYFYYRIIGAMLLFITAYSLNHMIQQAKEETRLWHKLFDKYKVSDWKNSWR